MNTKTKTKTTKLNFGCGDNILKGWINHDQLLDGLDVRKALPYNPNTAQYIFAEHLVEHLTCLEALAFLEQCYQVLEPGGVIRVAIPDLAKIRKLDGSYEVFLNIETSFEGITTKSRRDSMRLVLTHWGHKSFWTGELLAQVLWIVGFEDLSFEEYGQSNHTELCDIDGHYKNHRLEEMYPGVSEICRKEVTTIEGVKK